MYIAPVIQLLTANCGFNNNDDNNHNNNNNNHNNNNKNKPWVWIQLDGSIWKCDDCKLEILYPVFISF